MTAQVSDQLALEHPGLTLGEWRLYAVISGHPDKSNHGWGEGRPYKSDPGQAPWRTTANWKGYIIHFRLKADGRLVLDYFRYDTPGTPPRVCGEILEGDFYLVLKSTFQGPRLYIPFQNGLINLDQKAWLHENYIGNSPIATELRAGCHPDFPSRAHLWYE